MKQPRRVLVILGLALAAAVATTSTSLASIDLRINISGLDFKYDSTQNGSVFDAQSILGRGVDEMSTYATRVSQIDFSYGGMLLGSILSDEAPYVDFLIGGALNIKKTGGSVTVTSAVPTFGFDLLTPTLGRFLSLDFSTVKLRYINRTIAFDFTVLAKDTDLLFQNLPFGLAIDDAEGISVSVSGTSFTDPIVNDQYLVAFSADGGLGSVTAQGTMVPEPASFAALLVILVIGLETGAWMKRRQQRSFN
jgi:hypothetical protein